MPRVATGQAQVGSGENVRWVTSRATPEHALAQSEKDANGNCHRSWVQEGYPAEFAIALIQGKWKIGILSRLQNGPARLSQLRRMFPRASKKMLTQHLREMERDGLIVRADLSDKLCHVEYSLSDPRGLAVSRLIHMLEIWSTEYPGRNRNHC